MGPVCRLSLRGLGLLACLCVPASVGCTAKSPAKPEAEGEKKPAAAATTNEAADPEAKPEPRPSLPPIPALGEDGEELRVALGSGRELVVRWAESGPVFADDPDAPLPEGDFSVWLVTEREGEEVVLDRGIDIHTFTGLDAEALSDAGCDQSRSVGWDPHEDLTLADGRTIVHVSLSCMMGEDARETSELLILFARPGEAIDSLERLKPLWSGRGGWVSSLHDTCITAGDRAALREDPQSPGTLIMDLKGTREFLDGEDNWADLDPAECEKPKDDTIRIPVG